MTQNNQPVIRPVQPIPSNPKVTKPNLKGKPVGFGAAIIAAAAMYLAMDEGKVNTTYLDVAGIPTICYGKTGKEAVAGAVKTDAECEQLLYGEMAEKLKGVYRCVKVPLTTNQAAALLRFEYNVGEKALCGSSVARLANAGAKPEVWCKAMLPWDKARVKGILRPVKGLTNRRQSEYRMCVTPSPKEASNVRAKVYRYTQLQQRSGLPLQPRIVRSVGQVQIRWNLPLPRRAA